ncbi:hypothetical protein LshimejAT787_1205140 [Lyophyllum shimeji]|uniref:Uncharacterized protein n=1 Tax=Lyophyllum shimeji TaxID=47721 RepID=A0A9P3PUC7_LYOSH|nr:hypothetical protein LshimejAT787_1205140 [Lyophyllum shimeji]
MSIDVQTFLDLSAAHLQEVDIGVNLYLSGEYVDFSALTELSLLRIRLRSGVVLDGPNAEASRFGRLGNSSNFLGENLYLLRFHCTVGVLRTQCIWVQRVRLAIAYLVPVLHSPIYFLFKRHSEPLQLCDLWPFDSVSICSTHSASAYDVRWRESALDSQVGLDWPTWRKALRGGTKFPQSLARWLFNTPLDEQLSWIIVPALVFRPWMTVADAYQRYLLVSANLFDVRVKHLSPSKSERCNLHNHSRTLRSTSKHAVVTIIPLATASRPLPSWPPGGQGKPILSNTTYSGQSTPTAMRSAVLLASFAAFSTLVGASPFGARQSKCHPNFEGVGVSVVWDQSSGFNTREWAPNAVGANITTAINDFQAAAEFRFEQTNSPVTAYIAKKLGVPANDQVVSVGSNDQFLNIEYLNANDPNQIWDVSCDVCGTNAWSVHGAFASGCAIMSVNLRLCAQVVTTPTHSHAAPSFLLQMEPCNGAWNQIFDFWMV